MQCLEGHSGEFKPYAPFNRQPVELLEECRLPVPKTQFLGNGDSCTDPLLGYGRDEG